jgi:hypothetical protein
MSAGYCSSLITQTMAKPSDIKNETLRALLSASQAAIHSGDYTASVKNSAEAVRQLLIVRPDIFSAELRGRPIFPPLVGVRLVTNDVPGPQIIFDREKFVMAEALTWYQFALENILVGEP